MAQDKMEVFYSPIGGAGQIGMNLYLYGYKLPNNETNWIMVDCGIGFADDYYPGIDIMVPDINLGGWPALWLLGTANYSWPRCGELDMMEMGHA